MTSSPTASLLISRASDASSDSSMESTMSSIALRDTGRLAHAIRMLRRSLWRSYGSMAPDVLRTVRGSRSMSS